ncbi:MAG: LacI family DNA-binding transcriptional regulator, partial [Christensenellales bacterium]
MTHQPHKKRRSVNIRQIAELCNVSIATVSRAINHPEKVTPELYERIQKVIAEHNYIPNELAKQLFARDSKSLGLFVYDIANPFFTMLIQRLNELAFDRDYTLIICDTKNDVQRESKYLKYLQGIQVSALILTEGIPFALVREIAGSIPCVSIDRMVEMPRGSDIPVITSDNFGGAALAVDHLVSLGHRKIAVAGVQDVVSSLRRFEGFQAAMQRHGLGVPQEYICRADNMNIKSGVCALDHLLSLPDAPTAVLCTNDLVAQGVIQRAFSCGLGIPAQLSVVGFDGILGDTYYPQLTTVKQDVDKAAQIAINTALN